jgi:hypothetical protein
MEVFKDIKGYEGLYQVSNLGNIKSLDREVGKDKKRKIKGQNLKQMNRKDGYLTVDLQKEGKRKMSAVHRLVAEAFMEKPENCDIVNHKDLNKHNNNVENLEWTTLSGNSKHAFDNLEEFNKKTKEILRKGAELNYYKKIILKKPGEIHEFKNTKEVANFLGMSQKTVSGKMYRKRLGGYDIIAEK